MKKILIYFCIFCIQVAFETNSSEIKILYKINQNIITNHDVNEEINYLVSLNKNLNQLNRKQLASNAEQSLIREKIKKDEIEKIYNIDYSKMIKSERFEEIVSKFVKNLGFNSQIEFESYLKNRNLEIEEIKKKFLIEKFWNQLIFDKYSNTIRIDKNKINDDFEKLTEEKSEITSFNLSEIIFFEKDKASIEKKYQEIISSIKQIGFNNAATLHSISESSKLGGEIGWINENQISKKIFSTIKDLEVSEFSEPIVTASGIILIRVNDKKNIKIEINKEEEIKRLVSFEKNRILNEYSIIYYKEIENKAYVKKF